LEVDAVEVNEGRAVFAVDVLSEVRLVRKDFAGVAVDG